MRLLGEGRESRVDRHRCGGSGASRCAGGGPHWIVSGLQALDRRSSALLQRVAGVEALIEGSGLFRLPGALQPVGN